MDTKEMLDQLAELRAEHTATAIPIREQIAGLGRELVDATAKIDEEIMLLETLIKGDVLHIGETVKGTHLQAVWSKGRVTWKKELYAYALDHPELQQFRKVGEPSVSIRTVK